MKSIVLSGVVAALIAFSGCSTKEPAVDAQSQSQMQEQEGASTQEVSSIETETVSPEQSVVNSSEMSQDSKKPTIEDIESKLTSVYFDFDKYNIREDMQARVDHAANIGKTVAKSLKVKLEGNCDEWGSDEYNFALGLKRANSVKKALISEGIDASRISMVSYGESNPVCTEHTKECWAKNRRVDFKVLP